MNKDIMHQIRLYGKNIKNTVGGKKSYWSDIESWKKERFLETGKEVKMINVTTISSNWSRKLSPILMGPVKTYEENGKVLEAVSVEVAWQYSKVYLREYDGQSYKKLNFIGNDGLPNNKWFKWRNDAWNNQGFHWDHESFDDNKKYVRRAYRKGSQVGGWWWNGRMLQAEQARREIYANLYCSEVKKTDEFQRLLDLRLEGDLLIYDIDGYDYVALGMKPEDTIRDLNHSWGHGLLLTLMLQGIDPTKLNTI